MNKPLSHLMLVSLSRVGCIARSQIGQILRRTDLEISDEIVAKLRLTRVTASGGASEAAEGWAACMVLNE